MKTSPANSNTLFNAGFEGQTYLGVRGGGRAFTTRRDVVIGECVVGGWSTDAVGRLAGTDR